MIFESGQKIMDGKYVIVELIGKGGFGEVYKARNTKLFEKIVAIKVIQRGQGSTSSEFDNYQRRFEEEARIGVQVDDPNVIGVFELGQEGDTWFVVMEYAEGKSLKDKIIKGPLSGAEVVRMGVQVCKGVAALHRLGYVHRDIKPSNILFDNLDRAKIADLGLVQTGESLERDFGTANKHPGTPFYMSPEQENETGALRPASDIYAIGCILFEALTQKVYQTLPPETRLRSLNDQVFPELERVIEKALSVEINKRYPDADTMMNALDSVKIGPSGASGIAVPTGTGQVQTPALDPTILVFRNGEKAKIPEDFTRLADQNWIDAANLLGSGKVENWLTAINRAELAIKISEIRKTQNDPEIALEQLLYLIDPMLAKPQLQIETNILDYGQVAHSDKVSKRFTIANPSRGLLYGSLESSVAWLRLPRTEIRCRGGQTQIVEAVLDAAKSPDGEFNPESAITIRTNAGQVEIGAHVNVTWEPLLGINPASLNFGEYVLGQESELRQLSLTVRNRGGGVLRGSIRTNSPWLAISPASFELAIDQELTVQITADPSQINQIDIYHGEIEVAAQVGIQLIPVSLSVVIPGITTRERWKNWGIYLGMMVGVLLGWAIPLAFGISWLLGIQRDPETWQIVVMAALPLLVWVVDLILSPRFVPKINQAEDFYHRSALSQEITGRKPGLASRLIFSGLVAGFLILLTYNQTNPLLRINLEQINRLEDVQAALRALPSSSIGPWLAGLLGFLSGFLLLSDRPAGAVDPKRARLLAGPRAIILAVLVMLIFFFLRPQTLTNWTALILPALLGLLLSGEAFATLPVRIQWLYAQVMPVVPAAVLMGLFFQWAKTGWLRVESNNLTEYYIRYRIGSFQHVWWRSLLYTLAIVLLGGLGAWLTYDRQSRDFRARLIASLAALIFGGLAGLLGYWLYGAVVNSLARGQALSAWVGWFGVFLGLVFSSACLWALSDPRRWLKRGLDWFTTKMGALFARIPALTRRAAQAVRDSTAKAGLGGAGMDDIHLPGADRARDLFGRAQIHTGLGDYLSGEMLIPLTASLLALVVIVFSLPAFYSLLAGVIQALLNIGRVVLILLLCAGLPAAMIYIGYRLWRKGQVNFPKM